jgi:hypothetical protein
MTVPTIRRARPRPPAVIDAIRFACTVLGLVLAHAAYTGRNVDPRVAAVGYVAAAMVLTAVWGLGRIYRQPVHGGHR